MSSTYGEHLKLSIFGQSHAPAIGMTLDGIPAGQAIDLDELQRFLDRRAPGRAEYATPRKEADRPEFLAGLVGNVTCGAPLAAIIRNTNTRSGDYSNLAVVPRPGHADYTAAVKYGGAQDAAGGGHFSGRLTAPLCIAGGVCLQLLRREGIEIISRIAAVAGVEDLGELTSSTAEKKFPVVDDARGAKMRQKTSLMSSHFSAAVRSKKSLCKRSTSCNLAQISVSIPHLCPSGNRLNSRAAAARADTAPR